MLADNLHLIENVLLDDGFVGVLEDRLLLNGVVSLFLIPDGIGVGLEVYRTACVLSAFQNMNYGACVLTARIFGCCVGTLDAHTVLVSGRGKNSICL